MNSYNENLHSTVVATLQAQELEENNLEAALDTSMFTLYYAGGARISAAEKLKRSQTAYDHEEKLKEQAVINNNISVNLLTSANQEKQYVAQSVTNTSVAAANIQAASNAILKLAGDMGSIYSMVGAADFDTDIYLQSREAHRLMNQTAFDAERVSQTAMEASTLTAEVSAAALADEAKTTNDAVGALYKVISTNFDTITAAVAADNAVLASTSATEKQAEGNLEAINVEYFAASKAYDLDNRELNIDLKVPEKLITKDSYTVSFNYYTSPFGSPKTHDSEENTDEDASGYPVSHYYILLVKDNQKSTFALSNAESIISSKDSSRYVIISGKHKAKKIGDSRKIFISELKDSDGDKMVLGASYVVFVMAELMTEYKKNINDFSDYLSAPSSTFALTNQLTSPLPGDISVKDLTLTFDVKENESYNVEYRCMFLPVTKRLIKGLLSEQGLRTQESEILKLEKIAELYNPKIEALEMKITSLQSDYDAKQGELRETIDKARTASPKEKQKLIEQEAKLMEEMDLLSSEISKKTVELKQTEAQMAKAMASIDPSIESSPGFFFNLIIAEQVAPANYSKAVMTETKDKDKDKTNSRKSFTGTLTIRDTVTDNFGSPLMEGYRYIPVVLSFASPLTQDVHQFSNSLSIYVETESFVYSTLGEHKK